MQQIREDKGEQQRANQRTELTHERRNNQQKCQADDDLGAGAPRFSGLRFGLWLSHG
jgi:hypothetical protein